MRPSKPWQWAIKETHSGLTVVKLATFQVVSHFNDGANSIKSILQELGIEPGAIVPARAKNLITTGFGIHGRRAWKAETVSQLQGYIDH